MDSINPNELDAIFREGAEKHEYKYNEESWKKMSQKLDKRDRKNRIIMIWISMLSVLLLGFLYLVTSHYIADSNITEPQARHSSDASAGEFLDHNIEPSVVIDNYSNPSREEALSTIKTYDYNISTAKVANMGATSNTSSYAVETISQLPGMTSSKTVIHSPTDNLSTIATEADKEVEALLAKNNRNDNITSTISTLSLQVVPDSRILLVNPIALVDNEDSKRSVKINTTLYAASEWSSVGLFNRPKSGWKLGFDVGFTLGNKIELLTGVGYSKKIYNSPATEYQIVEGWTADVVPETMDSKCYIIDIPFTTRYYQKGTNENSWFAELGVSSYLMNSEWYGFNYSDQGMKDLLMSGNEPMEVIEKNKNKHFVGVGNIAIGYQVKTSEHTFLQIAPYVQIPLTGIGAGHVDLHSTGVKLAYKIAP